MESSTEDGSSSTALKAPGSSDRQSAGRSSDDAKEAGSEMDLEEKPYPPPQAPTGAPADHDANRDPPDEGPTVKTEGLSSTTTPPTSRSAPKKKSKTSRMKMKAPESDAEDQTDNDGWTEEQLESVFYRKDLYKFLTEDRTMKIMQLKLIGDLQGPVKAPREVSNKLDAVKALMRMLKEAGIVLAVSTQPRDASGTPSAASGSAGASVTVPRSLAATPMAAGEGTEGSSPPTPPSSPGSSPVLAYLLGATPTVVSTPPGSPATHSVSVGCQTDPTDGDLPSSAQAEPSEPSSIERQLLQLGHLVVGVARQRPRRIDSVLDSRLESATDLGEILSAAVAPARLSLAESEEIISLRDEIARLQAQCADSEDRLYAEVQQREKIEVFCTQATSDSNQAIVEK
uniref:Uncharacterized protein n=1 Tax=Phytophthora ramorum TaxID=164328 RepID=H3H4A0_PHYRM